VREPVRNEDGTFQELHDELLDLFRRGVYAPLEDEAFNDLALRIFHLQVEANPIYGAFSARRLKSPQKVEEWEGIPFLPARAFKAAPLITGDPASVEAVFRTSGTTGGKEVRGAHHVRSLELYRGSLTPNFQAHLLPEGKLLPTLALLPSPQEAPESSLSFMVGEMAGEGSAFFFHPTQGLRVQELFAALRGAEEDGVPVLLAGTAFAFVHWLEAAQEEGWSFRLPQGSRVLETGGFKGRARNVPRKELYGRLSRHFGVGQEWFVNEYGMTELLSQFYEPILASSGGVAPTPLDARFHRGPPWVRTRVLHPLTLQGVEEGEVGILAHMDLANLGSVSAILTEDLGRRIPGGIVLQGRTPGAEPRGCSLAMEDFLEGLEENSHVL
jgi:hypothetical protein